MQMKLTEEPMFKALSFPFHHSLIAIGWTAEECILDKQTNRYWICLYSYVLYHSKKNIGPKRNSNSRTLIVFALRHHLPFAPYPFLLLGWLSTPLLYTSSCVSFMKVLRETIVTINFHLGIQAVMADAAVANYLSSLLKKLLQPLLTSQS